MSYNYPSSNAIPSQSMPASSASPAGANVFPPTTVSRILIAHVVCGALATLLLLPLGVLIPRYARAMSKGRWWFPLHVGLQLGGTALAVAALAIGYQMGAADGTAHPGLAIALITGLGVQVLLGMFAHWYKRNSADSASSPGRGVFHFAHIGLGIVVVMLGWATSLTGFIQQWVGGYGAGLGQFVTGWKVILGVFIGLFGIAYVGALVGLSAHRRQGNIVQTTSPGSSEKALTGTRVQE